MPATTVVASHPNIIEDQGYLARYDDYSIFLFVESYKQMRFVLQNAIIPLGI